MKRTTIAAPDSILSDLIPTPAESPKNFTQTIRFVKLFEAKLISIHSQSTGIRRELQKHPFGKPYFPNDKDRLQLGDLSAKLALRRREC